jgi:hypothetical protein
MEVEGELSDQEALQLGESSGTSKSSRMPKLQPINPRSAEEPTPGDMHVVNEIKSMLQCSPHTGEKPHDRRRRADYNSQPAETGNRKQIVIQYLQQKFRIRLLPFQMMLSTSGSNGDRYASNWHRWLKISWQCLLHRHTLNVFTSFAAFYNCRPFKSNEEVT